MEVVLTKYEHYLREKGNKVSSLTETLRRLRYWHDARLSVADFTPKQLEKIYRKRRSEVSADTHRNELGEVKTFWKWCVDRFVSKSPAEGIMAIGRRRRGKVQLRKGEAQAFHRAALKMAVQGDEGALASLCVLFLGLRSNEIRSRKVRDVDITGDGVTLWITDGKTDAATRRLEVPPPLSELLSQRAAGRGPLEWLFPADSAEGYRTKTWLRKNVRRICEAAGIPVVCPHGLRGTWATLTTDAGVSGFVVAREMGHTNLAVTEGHYIKAGASERARTRKMLQVIQGGKKKMGN